MDLNNLTTGERIVAAAGALLAIDLLFLPWHSVDLGLVKISRTGVESPNAFWGVLALLLSLALVAVIVISRLTTARLPDLPIPWSQAVFIGAVAVAVLLVLKLLLETDALGIGAWLGIILAAAVAYGGTLVRKEAGPPGAAGPGPDAPPRRSPI